MRRADVEVLAARVAERLPGAVCRPLWDGSGHGYVLQGQHQGRAFEIRTKRDLARIAPKRRPTHGA